MKRLLGWELLTILVVCLTTGNIQARENENRNSAPPNILLILADDLGIGDVGCYHADSKIPTPHIDRLAAEGMRFTHAYSAAAVCVPSRYGLLTGRYPFRGAPLRWRESPTIADGRMTLASLLRDHGYRTACVGKWHCGFEGGVKDQDRPLRGGPLDRGFDHFFGQHGSLDQPPYFYIRDRMALQPATLPTSGSQEERHSIIYQGKFWREGKIAPNFRHEEVLDRYTEEALASLRHLHGVDGEQPFFLYFALTAPHGPWLPNEDFQGRSDIGPLGDFVMHVDHVVGRMLNMLDELGIAENTLVMLSSDNGPLWFEPDVEKYGHDSSGGFRGRKGDIWEGGIRMPLIARWPRKVEPGATSGQLCGLVDLLATFADLLDADLPAKAGIDSYSFLPALLGEASEESLRESMVLQSLGPKDLALRDGPWKFIPWRGGGGFLPKPNRVTPSPGEPIGQLYHLENDPAEKSNLYGEHPEIVTRMSTMLERYRASSQTRP